MIDTIKLNIVDCSISDKTPLTIEPSPYLHDSQMKFIDYDLFIDNNGELVTGKKAYLNTDKYNVTIKPKYELSHDAIERIRTTKKYRNNLNIKELRKVELPQIDFNSGIFVQTSLPRYFNDNNFNSLTIKEEKKVINQLEKDLRESGIKTNIWDSNLSRLDIFSNIILDENFKSYAEIFSIMNLQRMEKFEYAGTTFLYRNGEQQICVYDKIYEMKNKNKEFDYYINQNVMRIENRLLRKRKILNVSGFSTIKDLYRNYDFVKHHFKNEVGNSLFKYEPKEVAQKTVRTIQDEIEFFYQTEGNHWLQCMLETKGLEKWLNEAGVELLIEAVNGLDFIGKMKKCRLRKKIQMAQMRLSLLKKNRSNHMKTNAILYSELKNKFYKSVA